MEKDLSYYVGLPYNYIVQHIPDDGGGYYFSKVLELDGCHSDGATKEEALESLREAMEGWLETKLEFGDPIPEPVNQNDYSGKFLVRLPKSLHQRLSIEAEKEGVSLNQYALYKLSR
ncbi:MAG: type II toxin-antitoxin system HicB family antitoxin [Clostridiales bacterium]|jgi:predicted RNase H-like HicB family nuclease|nr:type II toxin-antitoxin system HicB family antitoxin [Clostridiales bacterium]